MDEGMRNRQPDQTPQPREKRPYRTPKVIDYGSVSQLTAGSLSKQADNAAAGFKRLN
jgi:hypothetical protein